jgi:5'-deoxynucleotidase YfbR-like HD superfamily hydrolase
MDAAAVAFGMAILPQVAAAEPCPIHLTEPNDEFRANEAKAMEFKRGQLMLKKEFLALMDKFPSEPNDEDVLIKDIHDFQMLVKKTQVLPVGLKKDELFKRFIARKPRVTGLQMWKLRK